MSGCKWVGDQEVATICEIKSLKTLKLHELSRITDQSLVSMARLPNLNRLYIGENRTLTLEGLKAFSDSSGLQFLEIAKLDKLSPMGLKNLPRLQNLEELTISSVKLSNEHLLAMKGMLNLRVLDLNDTSELDAGVIRKLRSSLPMLNSK